MSHIRITSVLEIAVNDTKTIHECNHGNISGEIKNFTPCGYLALTVNNTTLEENEIGLTTHPTLGVLLSMFALITITGNILVMYAVARESHLRSVTNYFMVSLAVADLIIGAVVMPFSIVLEVMDGAWPFGYDWCDIWHSFDVLASTASILNLCVIALDRYWAILSPITYPTRMSVCKAMVLIALVWICSAAISFPAILWWRAVTPGQPPADVCHFTEDSGYLIFSSIISFYVPVFIILFAYFRIYKAASEQTRSLRMGSKVMSNNHRGGQKMTLRIHRGGVFRESSANSVTYSRAPTSDSENDAHERHRLSDRCSIVTRGGVAVDTPVHQIHNDRSSLSDRGSSIESSPLHRNANKLNIPNGNETDDTPSRVSRTWRNFAISRKLSKIAKERKAAKTLGIVMGVFCICWVPFFVTNVLYAICKTNCVHHSEIIFPVFTWLGYINSGMNPIIYACSMRDFRRAFLKILCCISPKRFKYVNKARYQMSFSTNNTSYSYPDQALTVTIRNGNVT